MDRIDELLAGLLTAQDDITRYVLTTGGDWRWSDFQEARTRRSALRRQIANEWGEMVEALEGLMSAGPCDLCYEGPCDPFTCECKCHRRELDARERAWATLARVEGES